MHVAPVLCEPRYQSYIWGGRNLGRVLGRVLPPEGPIAESWEVSDVDGEVTRIASAPHAGSTLRDLIAADREAVVGTAGYARNGAPPQFPLLIKYLDAQQLLSVQVHPDDDYARERENGSRGKSEMWLILEAAPGAELYAGLKSGVGPDDVARAVREETLPDLLRRHEAKPGDVVLMPAGRVHALGSGFVVLEIQQTSNVTYRLYDWGRVGADGTPRALHVEKAIEVIDFGDRANPLLDPVARQEAWGIRRLLAVTRHFVTESWDMRQAVATTTGTSPDVFMAVTNGAIIRWSGGELVVPRGRTAVIPASLGDYEVDPDQRALAVRTRVPDLDAGIAEWPIRNSDDRARMRHVASDEAARRLGLE